MKKKLLILSALVFTLGFTLSVYAKGFHKLEAFTNLSKEKQTLVVETMKKNHETKMELRGQMKEVKKSMHEILTAPEFDAKAFQTSVDKMEELKDKKFDLMTGSIKELAPQMTQEEREILAQIIARGKHGHEKHGSGCGY